MCDQDDDGDFDAPEQIIDDPFDEIGHIVFHLQHAGREHDFAFVVDMVLLKVEQRALGKTVCAVSDDEQRRILDAIAEAAEAGYANPPTGLSRTQTMHGLLVLAQVVAFWHLDDQQRQARSRERTALRQALRVFRNMLHNACLLSDIAGMARGAQTEPVPSALAEALHQPGGLHFPTAMLRSFADAYTCAA